MWDEIQIISSDAMEIAEALIKNEVTLPHLRSVPVFSSKATLVEDAVWNFCKSSRNYSRYMELYPNGKYFEQVEENFWESVIQANTVEDYLKYRMHYPEGKHIAEVEECIWKVVDSSRKIADYEKYLAIYPEGVHASEVDDCVWEIANTSPEYCDDYLRLFPQGKHASEIRERRAEKEKEENKWQNACALNIVESYKSYLGEYPAGRYKDEAESRIKNLMIGQKESIISNLERDKNAYSLSFIKACGITAQDLMGKIRDNQGNPCDIVFNSWNKTPKNLMMGVTPTEIPSGCTEVYFWGVPGSGKTCAMAAILSCATKLGYFAPRMGEGLAYMNDLSTTFLPEINSPAVCLPTASNVDSTQYLPLSLNERITDGKKEYVQQHDLSIIEISGEIFECFSDEAEGKPPKSVQHQKTYEQLKNYLTSEENPKYHFFILDSKPASGDQMKFLANAALYFSTSGIFNETTQGISLIVTKSDVLSPDRSKWPSCVERVANEYFGSLVNQLKLIVGDPKHGGLGLSNGSLKVIPLSIGDVFFQSLCLFDPEPATTLVKLLIEYSKVAETPDWKKKIRRGFRK